MLTHENVLSTIANRINKRYAVNANVNMTTGTGLSLHFTSPAEFEKILKLLTLDKQFVVKGHARAEGGYIYILHSDTQRFLEDIAEFPHQTNESNDENVEVITRILYEKIKVSQRSLVEAEINDRMQKHFQNNERESERFYVEQTASGINTGSVIPSLFASFKLNPFQKDINCNVLASYFKQIFPNSNIGVSLNDSGLKIHFIPLASETEKHISDQAITLAKNDCLQLQAYLESFPLIKPTTLSYDGRHLTVRHAAVPYLLECFKYDAQNAMAACNNLYVNETQLTYSEYIIKNNQKLVNDLGPTKRRFASSNRSISTPDFCMFSDDTRTDAPVDLFVFQKSSGTNTPPPAIRVTPQTSSPTSRR